MEIALEAAQAAGAHLNSLFGQAVSRQKGSSQNLVTQADEESEALITRHIRARFPHHAILGEEGGASGSNAAEDVWVIDPLDATNNYAHGIPHFAVSIVHVHQGRPQTGVILDPVRQECFHAERDRGAFLNHRPIQVSGRADLTECILTTGFPQCHRRHAGHLGVLRGHGSLAGGCKMKPHDPGIQPVIPTGS